VMLKTVSPPRAEGASPHFPRRGDAVSAVTRRIQQLHSESCSYNRQSSYTRFLSLTYPSPQLQMPSAGRVGDLHRYLLVVSKMPLVMPCQCIGTSDRYLLVVSKMPLVMPCQCIGTSDRYLLVVSKMPLVKATDTSRE
jgi:hypothetical protein